VRVEIMRWLNFTRPVWPLIGFIANWAFRVVFRRPPRRTREQSNCGDFESIKISIEIEKQRRPMHTRTRRRKKSKGLGNGAAPTL
jgi:hypothetical protein